MLDTGPEGNSKSFPRRRESTGWGTVARHTGFKAVSTGRGNDIGRCRVFESGFVGLWGICRIGTMLRIVFTLTFDSSPIKGEGDMVGLSCCMPRHCLPSGLRIKSAMTGQCVGSACSPAPCAVD